MSEIPQEILDYIAEHSSPSQRQRLKQHFAGPKTGETDNAFCIRMNKLLTKDDLNWILEFEDFYTETVK